MTSSPYDVARRVNLIKSPSVAVPPPITFPTDLHPLPPDLQAYFVYPFSLESYVLDPNSPSSRTLEEFHERHVSYLEWRKSEKERIEKERLRKVAPGWDQTAAPLQPNRKSTMLSSPGAGTSQDPTASTEQQPEHQQQGPLDAMQELVEHLNKLDAAATASSAQSENK
ncbi:unnamed protein product [Sympodiomycopsis kandeliae]